MRDGIDRFCAFNGSNYPNHTIRPAFPNLSLTTYPVSDSTDENVPVQGRSQPKN